MLEAIFVSFTNRLLAQESWARERLAPFAGRTVRIEAAPFPPLRVTIREDGLVAAEATAKAADAMVSLRFGAVDVSGDEALADALRLLVRNLRPDVEEELSKLVGDIAARRLAQGARDLASWQRDAASRLGESFGRYLVDEARVLTPRRELDELSRSIAELGERLERLEKRLPPLA
jgi:ubiquinone biosynthesis protein UbiJ